jgi:cytochrome c biogenesis DsbD-like protein
MKFTLVPEIRARTISALNVLPGALVTLSLGLITLGSARANKPSFPQVPSGKEVVSPTAYVSLDPAGRGSTAEIAVVLKIRPGFHVNAREKSAEYLIATDLKSEVPAGFSAGEVSYPKGKLEKFTFSKDPLNVYQDTVILKMPFKVLSAAPLGATKIPLKLRYQACSTELCLPPATLNIEAAVNVVAAASGSKPAHPEIFKK